MRPHVDDSATQRAKGLAGRVLAGGAESRRLLTGLLGIDVAGPPVAVRAVAWLDTAVEAAVVINNKGDEIVARIENRGPDSEGFVLAEHVVLYYRLMGHELPRRLAVVTEKLVPRRLVGWSLERIMKRLQEDPELGKPGLPMPATVDEQDRPRSLLDTWGDPTAYADFFAGGEMSRTQLDSLDPTDLYSFIQHSDAECNHVNPHSLAPIVWLVNYPWEGPRRHRWDLPASESSGFAGIEGIICSNLTENDVILGNPEKLDRVLAQARKLQEKNGKPIFFSNTCVPVVTGEDVESKIERCRAQGGCKMHYLTVTPRSMVNVFEDVLVDHRLKAEAAASEPVAGRVNLVGFARDAAYEEVRGLLEAAGVEVGVTLLPDLSEELVGQMPEAALNVLFPNQLWQHLYDQVILSSRTPHIEPPAPFGFASTEEWLGQIAARVGREAEAREAWETRAGPLRAEWEALQAQADAHRIALVVRAEESYYLTRPAATWGIPVVSLLEEMGFHLDVFLKAQDRENARRAAGEIHAVFRSPERHVLKAFNSLDMMRERLADSGADAALTAHFFDWRVTSSGMSPFSLQQFEMGPEGALRTARRLLAVCRTPFYRRYARYLGRSRAGLRQRLGRGAS